MKTVASMSTVKQSKKPVSNFSHFRQFLNPSQDNVWPPMKAISWKTHYSHKSPVHYYVQLVWISNNSQGRWSLKIKWSINCLVKKNNLAKELLYNDCFSFHYNLLCPPDTEKEEKQLWKSHLTEFADGTQWSETVTTSACGGMLCVCLHAWAWVETRLNEAPLWDRHPSEVAAVCVSLKKKVSGGNRKLAWGQHPPHDTRSWTNDALWWRVNEAA